jgi:hypothetical protein
MKKKLNEVVYTKGHLYKMKTSSMQTVNFANDVKSQYTFELSGELSSKKSNSMDKKIYVEMIGADSSYPMPENICTIATEGVESEVYYYLSNADDLVKLSDIYSLSHPLSNAERQDFEANFQGWRLNTFTFKKVDYPVVASVKIDRSGVAYLLKLYRGNYIPTEQEIANSKAYWAGNPL